MQQKRYFMLNTIISLIRNSIDSIKISKRNLYNREFLTCYTQRIIDQTQNNIQYRSFVRKTRFYLYDHEYFNGAGMTSTFIFILNQWKFFQICFKSIFIKVRLSQLV